MVDGALNCCILKKDGNYITSVDVCWIRQNDCFNNYFLMSLILFGKNQNKLLNLSSGSGRVRISKKNLFNEFSFKLPSIQEQIKISNFLSDIDLKIDALNTKIENSKTFKKGLLQQMFV
jgi:type I restriction enzyme S subunit